MYPQYFKYPNMNTEFPFHMKKKTFKSVPSHRHDFLEMSLVIEGTGTEFINGTEHEMAPGTTALLLPHQIHHYKANPNDPLLMYICNFDMKLLAEGSESAWGLRQFVTRRDTQAAYVQLKGDDFEEELRIWNKLYREYNGNSPWKPILLKALLLEALVIFARCVGIAARQHDSQEEKPAADKGKSLWNIVDYVYDHYLEPLTLNRLAEHFGLHPTHISKLFRNQYGIHFVEFVLELRVRHACSLLLTSDMSIADIAFESGFTSYPTFSRAFLNLKGVTPRVYRELRGNGVEWQP